ncbi:MAG: phytanoyl-CoA dioxygenase family protein [bacterium]|nr:phytanoyl-CoA dioxygenase family protein [bacterium]
MDDMRNALLRDGFVIVRGAVAADALEPTQQIFEELVNRQRLVWSRQRGADDPPGGVWETSAQPRLASFDGLVESRQQALAVELLLGQPLQTSRRIMNAPVAPTQFMMMCNPVRDHGPAAWHRDIHPIDQAPVIGLQQDLLANGPGYLQWNLALHDDDVLWVVPGSHTRPNTAAENRCLTENPRRPLPEGLQVCLGAGDAVVYTNLILHWGSNYSPTRRRTVHFGFRSFGADLLPYVLGLHRRGDPSAFLSADARPIWQEHRRLYNAECDVLERAFHAAIQGDREAFLRCLIQLHPGEQHREVCLILLSKLAHKLCFHSHPERPGYGGDFTQQQELAPRFAPADLQQLWARFAPVDAALQAPGGRDYVPGYQSGPMSYRFESMPQELTVDRIVGAWV